MPSCLLTDRQLPGLVPPTRTEYADTHTPGLVLRVSGASARQDARGKVWYFRYRHQGKREALRLGIYPGVTLKEARTRATAARRRLDDGENPAAERRTPAPAVYTFAMFVPVFVAFQKSKTKDWKNEEGKIARHLLPAWGERALASLTRSDVQARLDAATAAGLTVGVNRLQALISRIFSVALNRGLIDSHPAARMLKSFPESPRDRVLSDQELRALWAGLDAHPGAATDAMKLRLLLGQRGAETAGMLWSELDLDAGVWSLPRARTKTKQPHMIGLPPTALVILDARRALVPAGEPRVFPELTLQSKAHHALAHLHGGRFQWKDLRRTNATRLGAFGFDDGMIDLVQNRRRTSITAKHYNLAHYVEPIRAALTQWDAGLARVLRGEPMLAHAPKRGKVLRMPAAPVAVHG